MDYIIHLYYGNMANEIKPQNRKTKYLLLAIYLVLVGIFYFFTLSNGIKSAKESSFVTDVFLWILRLITFNKVEFNYDVLHQITRKLVVHYGYNLIIGVSCYFAIYGFKGIGKITLIISILCGLFVAVSGELLQYIPASRGPSFGDAMINFAGEVTGILISFLILYLVYKKKQKAELDN